MHLLSLEWGCQVSLIDGLQAKTFILALPAQRSLNFLLGYLTLPTRGRPYMEPTCSRSGELYVFLLQDVLHPWAWLIDHVNLRASFLCELNPLRAKFLGKTTGNINAVRIWARSVAAQSFYVLFEALSSSYPSWVSRHYSCSMCCFLLGKTQHGIPQKSIETFWVGRTTATQLILI